METQISYRLIFLLVNRNPIYIHIIRTNVFHDLNKILSCVKLIKLDSIHSYGQYNFATTQLYGLVDWSEWIASRAKVNMHQIEEGNTLASSTVVKGMLPRTSQPIYDPIKGIYICNCNICYQ
ncbi:hypothetical protein LOAG_11728 [Loa loa]|uniref:Uncharacterized protein n=1 Tax=Loa loa TaxID=7209 RepID=A0A1S0TP11_LOALO|nr:hypothetical protein LOAG_11728 [Loa loa]EFO16776.1 hypothetical protein LOAG_11728 [Loa loa]